MPTLAVVACHSEEFEVECWQNILSHSKSRKIIQLSEAVWPSSNVNKILISLTHNPEPHSPLSSKLFHDKFGILGFIGLTQF